MATRLTKKELLEKQKEEERYNKACAGKDAYPTKAAAMGHRAFVLKKKSRNKGMATMSAYQCTFCGEWHLGHQ